MRSTILLVFLMATAQDGGKSSVKKGEVISLQCLTGLRVQFAREPKVRSKVTVVFHLEEEDNDENQRKCGSCCCGGARKKKPYLPGVNEKDNSISKQLEERFNEHKYALSATTGCTFPDPLLGPKKKFDPFSSAGSSFDYVSTFGVIQ